MVVILKAREGSVFFTTSDLTMSTASTLATIWGGTADTNVKNITISAPEGALDKIDCLGETSNFQNQFIDEKSWGMASMTGTMILDGDEMTVMKMITGSSGTAITGGYTRWQMGSSASGNIRIKVGGVLVTITDGTNVASIAMDNAYVTKFGDIKLTGADGHWEVDFEATCLVKDFYIEFKD